VGGRWRRIRGRGAAALLALGLVLPGCAGTAPGPRPDDFPLHTSSPPVEIHWRVSLDPRLVRAEGLIERRQHVLGSAWLQLLGFDVTGATVSFTTPVRVRWLSNSDFEWFSLQLRPLGTEQQFDVRVYSFEHPEESTP
jgi:hypothetical protein